MARQSFQVPPSSDHIGAILWDADGRPILEMWASEYVIHEPADGSVSARKLNTFVELMCGTMWHPGMAQHVPVGVCQLCREPLYTFPFRERPRHGIVSLRRGSSVCARCGALACNRHLGHLDGQSLCLPCLRRHRSLSFLRRIFFRCEDE